MTDAVVATPAVAAAAVPAPDPVVAAPVVAPTPAPAAEPTPAPAAPATPEPVVAQQPPSLLSAEPAKPAPAAEPVAAAPATPDPAAAAPAEPPQPAPLPTYEAWTMPEGVTLDAEPAGKFAEMIGQFEQATKADHAATQAFGQKLVDFYIAERQRIDADGQKAWADTRKGWVESFRNDPEIGGNRQETSLNSAISMIEQFGGNADQVKELRDVFRITGAGDHPAVIRLLSNIGARLAEGKPVPAVVPRSPVPASRSTRRYGASANGAA